MVQEGDRVVAGQELARLNDTAAQVQLSIAQTELAQSLLQERLARLRAEVAQAEAERLSSLRAADAIPARQIDEAMNAAESPPRSSGTSRARGCRSGAAAADGTARRRRCHIDTGTGGRDRLAPEPPPGDGTTTSTVTEMFLLAPDGPLVPRAQLDEQFVGLVGVGQSGRGSPARARRRCPSDGGCQPRRTQCSGSLVAAQPAGGDAARTVEILILIEGPSDQLARLVLGQRMIARIAP